MTVGRPINYNADEVLEAAMGVFWRKGYETTSLSDLLAAMGLSRSSFYSAYGSKRQLFLNCLERYQNLTAKELNERLALAGSGRAFINETLLWAIDEVVEGIDPRGCLIVNTASEFAQRDGAVAERVRRGLEQYRTIFLEAVHRGQAEGEIDAQKDALLVASYLVTSMSGLRTMVKAGVDLESLRAMAGMVADAV